MKELQVLESKVEPLGVGITLRFDVRRKKWTSTFGIKEPKHGRGSEGLYY